MSDMNSISIYDLNDEELAFLLNIRTLTEEQLDELEKCMQSFIEENNRK